MSVPAVLLIPCFWSELWWTTGGTQLFQQGTKTHTRAEQVAAVLAMHLNPLLLLGIFGIKRHPTLPWQNSEPFQTPHLSLLATLTSGCPCPTGIFSQALLGSTKSGGQGTGAKWSSALHLPLPYPVHSTAGWVGSAPTSASPLPEPLQLLPAAELYVLPIPAGYVYRVDLSLQMSSLGKKKLGNWVKIG